MIHTGLNPFAVEIDAALGAVHAGYFSRRQRTAGGDRKRYRSSPAAGRDPQILRRAGDIQQRRQRRVRHRDLVFEAVQQRFESFRQPRQCRAGSP